MKLLSLIFAAMFAFSTVNVFAEDAAPAADKKEEKKGKKKDSKKKGDKKDEAKGDAKK